MKLARWPALLVALVAVLGLLYALLQQPAQPEPVRIGLSINLTGHGGTAGEYIREGAMLAVQEVNAGGGVHGRPLELLVRDDRNTREGVLQADRELVEAGVRIIIGHVASQNTVYAHDYLMPRGVLLFTPYTATTRLTAQDDLFFRTAVDNSHYGRGMARLLRDKGAHRVSVLMDMTNPSFVVDYVGQTRRHSDADLREVRFDPRLALDWDTIVAELLLPGPDAIVSLAEVSMTGIAAQKLRDAGYEGPLIASLWAQTPDLMRYGGAAVEGMSLLTFIDPQNQRPAFRRFSRIMQERLNRPANARSSRAYEAVMILAEALRRSPEPSVAALKQALLIGRFETLLGTVSFDAFGDVDRPLYEIQVRDGSFVTVGSL